MDAIDSCAVITCINDFTGLPVTFDGTVYIEGPGDETVWWTEARVINGEVQRVL